MPQKKKLNFTYTQLIAISFLAVIITGACLLMLPISSRDDVWTKPVTAFFTATSATCVTGLVTVDTFSHWSIFGQIVILMMIQIGGLGFMTLMTSISIFIRRKISLHERTLIMQSAGSISHSGIVKLIIRILRSTFIFEGSGILLLSIRFIPKMGFSRGLWSAIFHSVSAFCNAGFDLMGRFNKFSSLTDYVGDPLVSLTVAALIVCGGLGFLVWSDIIKRRFNFKNYELHTKIVLLTTLSLIVLGWILFFIFEYNNTLTGMPLYEKLIASLFQSITPRTAGFNTIDISKLSESSSALTIILMFIGGSPGSTAGGIKTTTMAVLIMAAITSSQNKSSITVFKKRVDPSAIRKATSTVTIYLVAVIVASIAICSYEHFMFEDVLFEVVSAIGTVGLTKGITPSLSSTSQVILIFLMYLGRIGGLSLVMIFGEKRKTPMTERPIENILIG